MPLDKSYIRHAWAAVGAIVAALLAQTAGALFWAGSITARVGAVERDVVRIENRLQARQSAQPATESKKEKCW